MPRDPRARLQFFWSCDTRVDLLSDELLREMRLAGCQRLSLGVESGSQRILDAIDKKITVDEILESTELAKEYGIKVRYFMMLGNRGETRETFQETLAFLERARSRTSSSSRACRSTRARATSTTPEGRAGSTARRTSPRLPGAQDAVRRLARRTPR